MIRPAILDRSLSSDICSWTAPYGRRLTGIFRLIVEVIFFQGILSWVICRYQQFQVFFAHVNLQTD